MYPNKQKKSTSPIQLQNEQRCAHRGGDETAPGHPCGAVGTGGRRITGRSGRSAGRGGDGPVGRSPVRGGEDITRNSDAVGGAEGGCQINHSYKGC